MSDDGPCSCDEALELRRELEEARAKAVDMENHWKNACDVGRRLEARLKREQEALSIAENRLAELLPLRDAVGKLAKANTRLTKRLGVAQIVIDDLRQALRAQEARAI